VSPGLSGIGSGVASAAQIKVSSGQRGKREDLISQSQNGRLESVERMLQDLVAQEQAKGSSQ
jgi:hypothetical protein